MKPRYQLPPSVRAETFGRDAFVTHYAPRRTFEPQTQQTDRITRAAGWAVPSYVMAEPIGKGTFTTKMLPRRTVSVLVPDALQYQQATMGVRGSLSGTVFSRSSLSGNSLGAAPTRTASRGRAGRQDPFLGYGKKVAGTILHHVGKLPPDQRSKRLRQILQAVDPKLPVVVEDKATQYARGGRSESDALRRALVASFANGAAEEVVEIGRRQTRAQGGIALGDVSYSATAAPGTKAARLQVPPTYWDIPSKDGKTPALPFSVLYTVLDRRVTGWDALKKVIPSSLAGVTEKAFGKLVPTMTGANSGYLFVRGGIPIVKLAGDYQIVASFPTNLIPEGGALLTSGNWKSQLARVDQVKYTVRKKPSDFVGDVIDGVGSGFKFVFVTVPKAIAQLPVDIANGLKDAVCELGKSGLAPIAGAAAGAAIGGPGGTQAGAAGGVAVTSAMGSKCAPSASPTLQAPSSSGLSSWLPIVALAGGGALLLVALKK